MASTSSNWYPRAPQCVATPPNNPDRGLGPVDIPATKVGAASADARSVQSDESHALALKLQQLEERIAQKQEAASARDSRLQAAWSDRLFEWQEYHRNVARAEAEASQRERLEAEEQALIRARLLEEEANAERHARLAASLTPAQREALISDELELAELENAARAREARMAVVGEAIHTRVTEYDQRVAKEAEDDAERQRAAEAMQFALEAALSAERAAVFDELVEIRAMSALVEEQERQVIAAAASLSASSAADAAAARVYASLEAGVRASVDATPTAEARRTLLDELVVMDVLRSALKRMWQRPTS